jgi:hypothetical protein
MTEAGRTFTLPAGWGVTNLTFHFEGEDLSKDERPFAGNVIAQLRTDVPHGTRIDDVVERDLKVLKMATSNFQFVGQNTTDIDGTAVKSIEFLHRDAESEQLQQVCFFLAVDGHVYTVTGVHRAGARFEKIRPGIREIVRSVLKATS